MGIFTKTLIKPNPLSQSPINVREGSYGSRACMGSPNHERAIVIGRKADGSRALVPLSRFAQHLVVTGSPGMRKTTLTSDIAGQLCEAGVSVVVLEPAKSEYAALLDYGGRVYGMGDRPGVRALKSNPFRVDEGVLVNTWIEDVTAAVADSYGATQDASGPLYLEALVRRLYRVRGIRPERRASGEECWPTVKTYLEQVDEFMLKECCSGKEVSGNIRGFLSRRGRSMAACPALVCSGGVSAADLLASGELTVVQLSDFGRGSARFLGMLLLLRIMDASRMLGSRPLHTVVVLEEAHSLFVDELSGRPTMFGRLYESALAELRASGVGFVTVDQRPSLLPAGVLANSVTKVAFASAHGDDRDAIERTLGLDEEQARRLGGLRAGEALFSTEGALGAEVVSTGLRR